MMDNVETFIRRLWVELENENVDIYGGSIRKYRRLDLEKETGIRIGLRYPKKELELLVEIGHKDAKRDYTFPDWEGMSFELFTMDAPEPETWHVCLRLEAQEHREVFINVCVDLVEELITANSAREREDVFMDFMDRWSRFFKRHGSNRLSREGQIGLFGELWWFRQLLKRGVSISAVVKSWRSPRGEFKDFELKGRVLEVKTTRSKEPRKVQINSERQLDDRGSISLHLLVVTVVESFSGGESLEKVARSIRDSISDDPVDLRRFNHLLRESGYLETATQDYVYTYTVKSEELFQIRNGFPRIINIPSGLGDLRYSLQVSSCSSFSVESDEYIESLKEVETNG